MPIYFNQPQLENRANADNPTFFYKHRLLKTIKASNCSSSEGMFR